MSLIAGLAILASPVVMFVLIFMRENSTYDEKTVAFQDRILLITPASVTCLSILLMIHLTRDVPRGAGLEQAGVAMLPFWIGLIVITTIDWLLFCVHVFIKDPRKSESK